MIGIAPRRVALVAVLGSLGLFAAGCAGGSESSLLSDPAGADEMAATPRAGDGSADGVDGDAKELLVESEAVFVRPIVEIPDEYPSAIEAVYGRYWLYWDAFAAAHGLPYADPSYGPLEELSTAENWESLQGQLRTFADEGLVLTLPEPSATEHMIRIPNTSILDEEEGAEVILQDCWIDDFVQQTVDGRVIVEQKEAKLMNVTMRVVDGEWRVDGVSRATAASDGDRECETIVS